MDPTTMDADSLTDLAVGSDKVLLRPHRPTDAVEAFELLHDNEAILKWLVWEGPSEREDLEKFYGVWHVVQADGIDYSLAIVERAEGALVGSIGIRFGGHPGTGDIGYWIGQPFWGRGYATDAIRLVAHLAFHHLGAHTLCAWVFDGNDASRAVLAKNGFGCLRRFEGRAIKNGRAIAEDYLTLLRDEWERQCGDWSPTLEEVESGDSTAP